MTILLTRARPQATATAARLLQRGYRSVIAPLVQIEVVEGVVGPAQAILVTSPNGAAALAGKDIDHSTPILAVGERTAATLRKAGFRSVLSADGDAAALAALALSTLAPAKGRVIHARGETITRSPLDPLRAAGFDTGETILYRTVTLPRFEPDILPHLATTTTALVYSPGSARRLADAAASLPAGTLPALHIIAISSAALAPLQGNPITASLRAASHPSEDAMLALLDKIPKNPVAPPVNRR